MSQLEKTTKVFADVLAENVTAMFGLDAKADANVERETSIITERQACVAVFFTGPLYGEYLIAFDERDAATITGRATAESTEAEVHAQRETYLDAFKEILHKTVGSALLELGGDHSNLTVTSPRVVLGRVIYPAIQAAKCRVLCGSRSVECHVHLDLMHLDLATSYDNMVRTLTESNSRLEEAVKKQQSQLVQSEKMASLGLLAAGVAHEINNPVGFIQSNLGTLGEYLEVIRNLIGDYKKLAHCISNDGIQEARQKISDIVVVEEKEDLEYILEDTESLIEESRAGTSRISEIVTGLRSFSRAEDDKPKRADINECIESTLKIVWNEIKYHCELKKELGDIPPLECFPGELSQVFVNLLTNAAQAIEGSGTITMATVLVDEVIEIRVSDTGSGIDSEIVDHLFSPFFTTKSEGKGTGLGLYISYNIVKKHGGSISVDSEKGKGSTFIVRLPLDNASALQDGSPREGQLATGETR